MIRRRPAADRGHVDHGWLDTHHTFSFATYHDPAHMGFRDLRVINDDVVQPGRGFGTHGHRDMEIVTYVIEGALEHRDSTGTGSVLRPGDVQRMTAGSGIRHSEFNASRDERLRLLQIWILPAEAGLEPGYEERNFPAEERRNRLRALVTPSGTGDTLRIHQDVSVHAALLDGGASTEYAPAEGRHGWVQVARGSVTLNDVALAEGDGAAVSGEAALRFTAGPEGAEFLYFDLA